MSKEKSSASFSKSITRKKTLLDLMEGPEGRLPFTYLGAPIFKGVSKGIYFNITVDKISSKFASWKRMLLTLAGKLQLVKLVVQSMMVVQLWFITSQRHYSISWKYLSTTLSGLVMFINKVQLL